MTQPTPKFKIGDSVWTIGKTQTEKHTTRCTDCGKELGHYAPSKGNAWFAHGISVQVDSISIRSTSVEYRFGGQRYPERDCYPTEEEAQTEADRRNKE